jgi:hypothetical protein
MTWPIDKIGLINQALALTGNNLVNAADDGSDEWNVTSAAYEKAIEYMFEAHDWKQITTVVTLNSTGVAPTDDQFDTAYAKPADCIHVIWVRLNDLPVVYQVLNNQIVLNATGVAPGVAIPAGTTPGIATMKYVSSSPPGVGGQVARASDQMTRTFMTALETFVEAGIYQGLHEDVQTARLLKAEAMALLQEAKTRSDQEQPKRAMFNSKLSASRRVRRPYPSVPTGWGGTGAPS